MLFQDQKEILESLEKRVISFKLIQILSGLRGMPGTQGIQGPKGEQGEKGKKVLKNAISIS
jgi:hypothetical protein